MVSKVLTTLVILARELVSYKLLMTRLDVLMDPLFLLAHNCNFALL